MRVISLSSKARNINAMIARQLQQEDIKIRCQTVAKILKQVRECGTLANKPAPGRKPIVLMLNLKKTMSLLQSVRKKNTTFVGLVKRLH